jgi:hypothetical protein
MKDSQDKPAQYVALDQLDREATSEADKAILQDWRNEINDQRKAALKELGHDAVDLTEHDGVPVPKEATSEALVENTGTIEPAAQVEASRQQGEDMSGAHWRNQAN